MQGQLAAGMDRQGSYRAMLVTYIYIDARIGFLKIDTVFCENGPEPVDLRPQIPQLS